METWSRETTLGIATIDREYLDASLQQRRIVEGPPLVALLMESGSYGFNEYISEGYERAVESLDARTQRIQFGPLTFGDEIRKLADAGAPYIVVATSEFEEAVVSVAADHPNTRFGILDGAVEDAPNVASIRFADQEGSFLVGAAAALKSQTGKIGFVGGVDIPVVHRCEAGFEAGARAVDPDIKISAKYLTPRYDLSGFASFTLGRQAATLMFRDGVDAVFTAAGVSDMGTFQAAAELTPEAGRQLWAIGVDTDEYYTSEVFAVREVIDPSQWKPHILTSMLKRVDVAIFTMMEEFAGGGFTKTRVLGLAEDGVGYSTSGGFIEDIVPVLEDLKAKIISGEIVVPALPEACTADSCARYRAGDG
jgi:basic membrane protein A